VQHRHLRRVGMPDVAICAGSPIMQVGRP